MEFVINEWHLDWHRGDEPVENQTKARQFFEWFKDTEHRIVVLRGSPFHRKLNTYSNICGLPLAFELKAFYGKIFLNFDKCRIIESHAELPELIIEKLRVGNFASDKYLFESAETSEEKIIVITDSKLIKHFENNDYSTSSTAKTFSTSTTSYNSPLHKYQKQRQPETLFINRKP